MPRFKTFANGGTLLTSDLNSIEDDFETSYATYLDLWRVRYGGSISSSNTVGTYVLGSTFGFVLIGSVPIAAGAAFWFNPADYTAPGSRLVKLRLRAECIVNAVAPAVNFVVGLYPITAFTGASLTSAEISTLGTVVAGSTVTYNAPALNTQQHNNSGDFTAPAVGWYCFGFTNSGTPTANSRTNLGAVLQMRNV